MSKLTAKQQAWVDYYKQGKTAAEANVAATNAGLLVRFSGATQTTSGNIRVLSQSLEAGQQVPAGTVITVQLGDANMTD